MNPSVAAPSAHLRGSTRAQKAREIPREPPPLAYRSPERTMTIKTLFERLSSELGFLAPVYARRHTEHPTLAAQPSLPDLIELLARGAEEDKPVSSAIVCALLELHQRSPHRLWAAILLHAFRPMLRNTWKKLLGSHREERLALFITAFHEAILRVDPQRDPVRIGMYVRQATRKGVFTKLREEREWQKVGFGEDADLEPDPGAVETPPVRENLLRQLGLPQAHAELVATLGQHGALLALVRRDHGSLPEAEQSRIYSRLREHRKRIVLQMRGRPRRDLGGREALLLAKEVTP